MVADGLNCFLRTVHYIKDAVRQACNVACLPGILGPSLAMPDIHQGYGFPIGGVAAFDPTPSGKAGPKGGEFTEETIGEALATREMLSHLRECGTITGGPAPFQKKDRSRFLQRFDEIIRTVQRGK